MHATTDTKLRFEHFACLAASSVNIEHEQAATDYRSHEPLCQVDKGYALYELHVEEK